MAYSKLYVTRNDKIVLKVDGLEKIESLSIFFGQNSEFYVCDDNCTIVATSLINAGNTLTIGKHKCYIEH